MHPNYATEVRNAISDPVKLCSWLGLSERATRQSGGLLVCCPAHGEADPSCSVTRGPDGTVRVRCFACGFSGDGLHLVAVCYGLSVRADFREVMALAAGLAGELHLRDEILGGERMTERKPILAPQTHAEAPYPPQDEVWSLWRGSTSVGSDADVWEALRGRGIDPDRVDTRQLARVASTALPRWATFRGQSWAATGHRLLVPMWDESGIMRSVRAWRIGDSPTPKRLPPAGHKAAGLVMANRMAWLMLIGRACPKQLVFVEGEPDFLSQATWTEDAVVGIVSGGWTQHHALRVPGQTCVILATHHDEAGDRYAEQIAGTLSDRCPVWRSAQAEAAE